MSLARFRSGVVYATPAPPSPYFPLYIAATNHNVEGVAKFLRDNPQLSLAAVDDLYLRLTLQYLLAAPPDEPTLRRFGSAEVVSERGRAFSKIGQFLWHAGADFAAVKRPVGIPVSDLAGQIDRWYVCVSAFLNTPQRSSIALAPETLSTLPLIRMADGSFALHSVVSSGRLDLVNILLAQPGCASWIDAQDRRGGTALMNAIEFDREDIARALLAAGAQVSACSVSGYNVLQIAVLYRREAMVRLLLPHCTQADLFNKSKAGVDVPNMNVFEMLAELHTSRGRVIARASRRTYDLLTERLGELLGMPAPVVGPEGTSPVAAAGSKRRRDADTDGAASLNVQSAAVATATTLYGVTSVVSENSNKAEAPAASASAGK